jgi:hypothetical protein
MMLYIEDWIVVEMKLAMEKLFMVLRKLAGSLKLWVQGQEEIL